MYTGVQIQQNKNKEIWVDQNEFTKSLKTHKYSSTCNDEPVSRDEMKLFRQSVGQLNWAATQSRPDLAFDAFSLSTVFNKTKISDTKYASNVIKKAKKNDLTLKFQQLGKIDDLHIELFVDASLGNVEDDGYSKSMMGYFIIISNNRGKFNPLHWK